MLRILTLLAVFFVSFAPLNSALAQDTNTKLVEAQNKALKDKVAKISKALDQDEVSHFFVMYSNYIVYSMVKAVHHDVSEAVSACTKNNPSMGGDLESKFSKWDEKVGDTMVESLANIENLSLAQSYLPQSEIKILFALVDETRAVNSSKFETVPVTTPEACEFMMSKMDETEQSMLALLKVTLASYPNILQKTQE